MGKLRCAKKKNWTPRKTAAVCLKHFTSGDFERRFSLSPDDKKSMIPRLKTDEFGICVWPSICMSSSVNVTLSAGDTRRMVSILEFLYNFACLQLQYTHLRSLFIFRHLMQNMVSLLPLLVLRLNVATCQDSSSQAACVELQEPQQELMEVSIFILLPKYFFSSIL